MQPAPPTPFVYLWGAYYTDLVATATTLISTGLAAVAALAVALYAIYFAILGVLFIWGRVNAALLQEKALRGLFVLAMMSPSVFNTFVVQPFLTDIPAFSARATGASDPGEAQIPQQFDRISHAVEYMLAQVRAQATGVSNIGVRLEIGLVGGGIAFVLLVSFVVATAAFSLQALLAVVFCVTCPGYLFKRTEGIADRTVGKLVGLSLLGLMIRILVSFVVKQNEGYLKTLADMPANIDAMVAALWSVFCVFGFGLFLLVMLPSLAAYIGGGVSFSPAPLLSGVANKLRGR